jgi:hypothetical protein
MKPIASRPLVSACLLLGLAGFVGPAAGAPECPLCPGGQEYKYSIKAFKNVEPLRSAIVRAAAQVQAAPPGGAVDQKKCRRIRFYGAPGGASGPIVRVREKLQDHDCKGEPEEWELAVKFRAAFPFFPAVPDPEADFDKYELDLSYDARAESFSVKSSVTFETKAKNGAAPTSRAEIEDRLPAKAGALKDPCGSIHAQQWFLATVSLNGNEVEIEAEQWRWAGDTPKTRPRAGKPITAEVSFKLDGATAPPEVAAFARALGTALKPLLDADSATKTEKALSCK